MNSLQRFPITPATLLVLLLVLLGVIDLWAGYHWFVGRQQVLVAQEQFHTAEQIAEQIAALRTAPARIEEKARTSDALARMVETAAKQVRLDPARIALIDPGEPRRIAESPYLEQGTEIELREVTLRQVVEFTIALRQSTPGMEVPTLSLRMPPGGENSPGEELWNVRMLLTSHIYQPKIPSSHQQSLSP